MNYRRPTYYVPPYDYCDRWCNRCRVDKMRCLVYQTETDQRLHREIDGRGAPTPAEEVEQVRRNVQRAVKLLEGQAREAGIDWAQVEQAAARIAPSRQEQDPLVEEAAALARHAAAFLRARGAAFPEEAAGLRRYHTLAAPKLARACRPAADDEEEAEAILQTQVAHRAAVRMAAALESIRRKRPSLADEMLDLLALLKRLREGIESRWLARPSRLLVPVRGDEWWGPLRDVTGTLRHLRLC